MDYKEIKKEIASCMSARQALVRENTTIDMHIRSARNDLAQLRNKEEKEIKEQSEKDLERARIEGSMPLERVLQDIDSNILSLSNNYKNGLKKTKIDKFRKKHRKTVEVLDSVDELNKEVSAIVSKVMGDRIKSEFFESLAQYDFTMDIADLNVYLDNAKNIKRSLKIFEKDRKLNFYEGVDQFLAKWNPCKDDGNLDESKVENSWKSYLLIYLVSTSAIIYFGASVLFVFCLVVGGFNIYRALRLRNIIFSERILSANVDKMRKELDGIVQEDYDAYLGRMEKKYNQLNEELEEKRAYREEQLQLKIRQIEQGFVFDDSAIKNKYNTQRKNKQKSIDDMNISKENNNEKIKEIDSKLQNLDKQLKESLAQIRKQYNTLKGEEYVLDPTYVLDIINNKPVTWDFPKAPCLFIHNNDFTVAMKFIKLFIVETMSKLKPGIATFEICDTISSGMDFMKLINVNRENPAEATRSSCAIYSSMSDVNNLFSLIIEEIESRKNTVVKETNSLDEYNLKMLEPEIGGICLDYKFIIIYNVNSSILSSPILKTLAQAGKRVGIYLFIVLSSDEVDEYNANMEELLNIVDNTFLVAESGVTGRSKNMMLEWLSSDK